MFEHFEIHREFIEFIPALFGAWFLPQALLYAAGKVAHRRGLAPTSGLLSSFLKNPLRLILAVFAADVTDILGNETTTRLYIAAIVWLLIQTVKVVKVICFVHFDSSSPDNLVARKIRTQLQFVERSVHVLLILLGAALILMTFDKARSLGGSIIASAGLATVVLGFAAQKTLGTFIAGFQVAFTQPIRIDDVVVVEGEWGIIEEITLTYVVIKIWDLRRLVVPISYFTEKPFQNWTRNESALLGYVFLYFDYAVDVQDLREKFMEILRASPLWDKKVAVAQVTEATERALQIRFLMGARNSPEAFDLRCEVREKLIAHVQATRPSALPQIRLLSQ